MDWETDMEVKPDPRYRAVKVVAHIRKNATGEIRAYRTWEALFHGETGASAYIWEEGNYSCDCNRELFFEYAHGKDSKDVDCECGDGRFSVNVENPATGDIFYREFD